METLFWILTFYFVIIIYSNDLLDTVRPEKDILLNDGKRKSLTSHLEETGGPIPKKVKFEDSKYYCGVVWKIIREQLAYFILLLFVVLEISKHALFFPLYLRGKIVV